MTLVEITPPTPKKHSQETSLSPEAEYWKQFLHATVEVRSRYPEEAPELGTIVSVVEKDSEGRSGVVIEQFHGNIYWLSFEEATEVITIVNKEDQ